MGATDNTHGRGARADIILGVSWTLTCLAILTLAGRLYTRTKRRFLGSDDWFMLAAMVFQIAYQAILQVACDQGLGKPVKHSTVQELVDVRKWALISSAFTNVVSVLARISISILLIRTFETKLGFHWFLIVSCGLMVGLGLVTPILLFSQVDPVEALWDYRMEATSRFSPQISGNLSLILQVCYMLSDITYVLFPIIIIWRLNMALDRKLGLGFLMALSLVTFGAALTKVVVVCMDMITPRAAGDNDSPCYNGVYSLATGIEQSLVITMGCIPTLGHAAKSAFPKIRGLGSTLASVISSSKSWRKQSSQSGSSGYSGTEKSCQDDLRLRPDCSADVEGDGSPGGPMVTAASLTQWRSDTSLAEGGVRRVDDFTITYETPQYPREEV